MGVSAGRPVCSLAAAGGDVVHPASARAAGIAGSADPAVS